MNLIDRFANFNRLTNEHPLIKFCFALIAVVISLVSESILVYLAIFFIMTLLLIFKAKIPIIDYIKYTFISKYFLVISLMALLFQIVEQPTYCLWSLSLCEQKIGITYTSLILVINLFFKALASVSCIYFLVLTTPISDIIFSFKILKFPNLVIEKMLYIYRFVFIISNNAKQIYESMKISGSYKILNSINYLVLNLLFLSKKRFNDFTSSYNLKATSRQFINFEKNYTLCKKNIIYFALLEFLIISIFIIIEF